MPARLNTWTGADGSMRRVYINDHGLPDPFDRLWFESRPNGSVRLRLHYNGARNVGLLDITSEEHQQLANTFVNELLATHNLSLGGQFADFWTVAGGGRVNREPARGTVGHRPEPGNVREAPRRPRWPTLTLMEALLSRYGESPAPAPVFLADEEPDF